MKKLILKLAQAIETRLPTAWKHQLLRRWLAQEMIADGWQQDPTDPKRLVSDQGRDANWNAWRFNMAEHEAIAKHFKAHPLH